MGGGQQLLTLAVAVCRSRRPIRWPAVAARRAPAAGISWQLAPEALLPLHHWLSVKCKLPAAGLLPCALLLLLR